MAVEKGSEMSMQRDHGSTHVERMRQAPGPFWERCGLKKVLEVCLPEAALPLPAHPSGGEKAAVAPPPNRGLAHAEEVSRLRGVKQLFTHCDFGLSLS